MTSQTYYSQRNKLLAVNRGRRSLLKNAAGVPLSVRTFAATPPRVAATLSILKTIGDLDGWPMRQYGDYIATTEILSDQLIAEFKSLCLLQAIETFKALHVPDASDKIKYIVYPHGEEAGSPWKMYATVGWRVTIPAPQWQVVLEHAVDKLELLKSILKTRKRVIPISLNGRAQLIPRADVVAYLKEIIIRG